MGTNTSSPRTSQRLSLLAAALLMAGTAMAQQTTYPLDIAPQALDQALNALAGQTGSRILFATDVAEGRQVPGLRGSLTVEQALERLVGGTGLRIEKTEDGSFLVAKPGENGPVELSPTPISSNALGTSASAYEHSYNSRVVTLGKTGQAQKDIPQSVTVVTRQRMDDQSLDTFDQVVMQTPGISRQFVNSGQSSYYSRGFEISKILLDSVSSSTSFGSIIGQAPDMATIERVEIIRGAPGLLLGAGEPSGVVNLVRKRPKKETELNITAKAGSWDYYRTELDLTGSLNDAGTVRGRAVTAYEDRDYFYDRAHSEMPIFYGVLEADVTDKTTAMVGYRHQNYDVSGIYFFQGLPTATNGSDLKLSRSTSVGPDWSAYKSVAHDVFSEVKHSFNDDWSAKIATDFQRGEIYERVLARSDYGLNPNVGTVAIRRAQDSNYDFYRSGVDISTEGNFSLFDLEQKVIIGTSYQKEERDYTVSIINYSGLSLNILNDPEMSAISKPNFKTGALSNSEVHTETYGLYSNLILSPIEPLKVIIGGRLSWYKVENYANGALSNEFRQDKEFTPYVGLVYALTPEWSAYASYTDIFNVQSSYSTTSGSLLDPAVGSNYEIGIKGDLFNGRLNTSAALFRIIQDNRAAIDPAYPSGGCPAALNGYCYLNSGKVESKGIELEANGEILPHWQAFAGYTYNEAKYLKDRNAFGNPTAKEGEQLGDVTPRHIFRAFTTFELSGALQGFTVGGGVSSQSKLRGTNYSGIAGTMPGRTVWDAFARYQIDDHWTVAANLNNVFDKSYYNDEYGYRYGEPRNIMLTLRGNFKDF